MIGSRVSFVGLVMISVLVVMMVVGLGNLLREGLPIWDLLELSSSFEDLRKNYHRSVFYQYPLETALFGCVVLGIPTLLAILYGITLHSFYSRCVLNSSSLSVTQFILLLVRSLIAFPVTATLMLLAISWQVARKVGFSSRARHSAEGQPNSLTFMDDLLGDSLWYLLFPWPGNCTLSRKWSEIEIKSYWPISDFMWTMPVTSDRLLRWLPVGMCILTCVAYFGPNIVLHHPSYYRGGSFVEQHPVNITFWISASVFLADYLVVTLRVVPFLKAQTATHKLITE